MGDEDMRRHMNAVSGDVVSGRQMMGPGMRDEGATAESGAPDKVRPDADPDLCKRALQRLSRHLTPGEIAIAIDEEPALADVFVKLSTR